MQESASAALVSATKPFINHIPDLNFVAGGTDWLLQTHGPPPGTLPHFLNKHGVVHWEVWPEKHESDEVVM